VPYATIGGQEGLLTPGCGDTTGSSR